MKIEWPPRSGRVADYEPHELEIVRGLAARCERGEISQEQLGCELGHLHDAKVELGAYVERPATPAPVSNTGLRVPAQLRIDQGEQATLTSESEASAPVTTLAAGGPTGAESGPTRLRLVEEPDTSAGLGLGEDVPEPSAPDASDHGEDELVAPF